MRLSHPSQPSPSIHPIPKPIQLETAHSLDPKGDERNADHQQVQDVEIVPAEGALVEESPVGSHLQGGTNTLCHQQLLSSQTHLAVLRGDNWGTGFLLLADNSPPHPKGDKS